MAIFLSRIKRALNVGSKNITNNGTYYASADGYDGYDEVTVNVSGGSATPITPSNASPAALTSGSAVNPTANGYAIASYNTVMPSGVPTSVSSGDIVKISGGFNSVIVDKDDMHDIKGSNTSPEGLYGGSLAKIWGNDPTVVTGYAIASYTPITPSSTPTSISQGDMVQVNGSGVIVTPTSVTPSDSTPPQLSQGNIYEPTANGYLYASNQSPTETVLWTNNSPTSTFAGQTITLSDSLDNYTYVKIKYRISTSVSTESSAIVPVSEFVRMTQTSNTFKIGTGSFESSTYVRTAYYGSATTIVFNNGYQLGSTSQANGKLIPVSVIGISVALPPSVGNVKVGVVTLSANSNNKITTGFKPNYLTYSVGTSGNVSVYNQDISTTQYKKCTSGGISNQNIGNTSTYDLVSLSDDGFTVRGASSAITMYYFAIG